VDPHPHAVRRDRADAPDLTRLAYLDVHATECRAAPVDLGVRSERQPTHRRLAVAVLR